MSPSHEEPANDPPALASIEIQLAGLIDPDASGRVPRLFSGRRSLGVSRIVDQAIRILHAEQPLTTFVVFSPVHPEGILPALAEAFEALYPTLTRRRLRRLPAPSWSSAAQLAMNEDSRGRIGRVLVIDPFEEIWEPDVSDSDRMQFLQNLATIANYDATTVLLVMDSTRLDHCQHSRLLQPCLLSRFHLSLASAGPAPRPTPPPVPTEEFLPLQPIRPRKTRPNLAEERPFGVPRAAPSPV